MNREPKKPKRVANRVNFNLERIEPLTDNQAIMFGSKNNLVAHGWAGTGKTFCASYLGLKGVMEDDLYRRLVYIRSAVSTRNIGFLKGDEKEKTEVYEAPMREIALKLFNRVDAYDQLKAKGIIDFMCTSFIRGINLTDAVVIVDEYQNMTYHELESIITRMEGDNNRIIFCGDTHQRDVPRESGISDFNAILRKMPEFDFVDFGLDDVVRGPLVKSYLKTKYEMA
jgi:phosphate starvation-inducible PhoH-like protein